LTCQIETKELKMNAIVIEHVAVDELPDTWRAQLHASGNARVTVRIEEEPEEAERAAFGMWRDREDVADPSGHVHQLRASRFPRG
jgi:hypothetical protein